MSLRVQLALCLLAAVAAGLLAGAVFHERAALELAEERREVEARRLGAALEALVARDDGLPDAVSRWADDVAGRLAETDRDLSWAIGERPERRREASAWEDVRRALVDAADDRGLREWAITDTRGVPLFGFGADEDSPAALPIEGVLPGVVAWTWETPGQELVELAIVPWRVDLPGRPARFVLAGVRRTTADELAGALAATLGVPDDAVRLVDPRLARRPSRDAAPDAPERVIASSFPGPRGRPHVAARVVIPAAGDELIAALRRTVVPALAAGLATAIVAAVALGSLATRPLGRLVRAVERITHEGAPSGPMPGAAGEAGRLGRAIDRMLASLTAENARRAEAEKRATWRDVARRVAHEVKNPLTPIRLAVDNLRRARRGGADALDEAVPVEADAILREVHRLDRLVKEFAEFAKLPEPHPRPCSVVDLARDALAGQTGGAPRVEARLVTDAGEIPDVRADPDLLGAALANLVRNAVQALGGEQGVVEIGISLTRGRVVVSVEDSGPGIPPELLDRIFEPYVRGRSGDDGAGLGLAIAQQIVVRHGGRLGAGRSPLGGARFAFDLPVAEGKSPGPRRKVNRG